MAYVNNSFYDNITALITDNIKFSKLRAEAIWALIVVPMTLEEIIQIVRKSFNIPIDDVYKYTLIERMLRSYIEYLSDTGIIKKAGYLDITNKLNYVKELAEKSTSSF